MKDQIHLNVKTVNNIMDSVVQVTTTKKSKVNVLIYLILGFHNLSTIIFSLAQYSSHLNTNYYCERVNNFNAKENGFCEFCARNQELKIQQLRNFQPLNEANFNEESEEYR
jgi:hypothetical protein